MSQYQIAFNDHPVHAAISQAREQLAALPESTRTSENENAASSLARLGRVLEQAAALLAIADPALINSQALDAVNEALPPISSGLPALKESEDFAQIPGIASGTDALLGALNSIAVAIGPWTKADTKKAAAILGEAAREKTKALEGQTSSLQERLNQLNEQIDQATTSLQAASEERINAMQAQLDALKAEAEAQGKTVQENATNFQTQFTTEAETRAQEFEAAKQELKGEADKVIEEARAATTEAANSDKERSDAAIEKFETRSTEIVEFLAKKKDEAVKLLDIVATSSTAGAFGKEADAQREQADRWRMVAIAFGLIGAFIGVGAIIASFFTDSTTSEVVAKVAAVTLLVGIAGYAASQSGQHRHREQRAKRLELELAAFGPFIEPLDGNAQDEARKNFIERLFVGDPGGEDEKGDRDPRLSDENLSAIAMILDVARQGAKS
jgi:uncharacterized protein YdcH (DUF465 family)